MNTKRKLGLAGIALAAAAIFSPKQVQAQACTAANTNAVIVLDQVDSLGQPLANGRAGFILPQGQVILTDQDGKPGVERTVVVSPYTDAIHITEQAGARFYGADADSRAVLQTKNGVQVIDAKKLREGNKTVQLHYTARTDPNNGWRQQTPQGIRLPYACTALPVTLTLEPGKPAVDVNALSSTMGRLLRSNQITAAQLSTVKTQIEDLQSSVSYLNSTDSTVAGKIREMQDQFLHLQARYDSLANALNTKPQADSARGRDDNQRHGDNHGLREVGRARNSTQYLVEGIFGVHREKITVPVFGTNYDNNGILYGARAAGNLTRGRAFLDGEFAWSHTSIDHETKNGSDKIGKDEFRYTAIAGMLATQGRVPLGPFAEYEGQKIATDGPTGATQTESRLGAGLRVGPEHTRLLAGYGWRTNSGAGEASDDSKGPFARLNITRGRFSAQVEGEQSTQSDYKLTSGRAQLRVDLGGGLHAVVDGEYVKNNSSQVTTTKRIGLGVGYHH